MSAVVDLDADSDHDPARRRQCRQLGQGKTARRATRRDAAFPVVVIRATAIVVVRCFCRSLSSMADSALDLQMILNDGYASAVFMTGHGMSGPGKHPHGQHCQNHHEVAEHPHGSHTSTRQKSGTSSDRPQGTSGHISNPSGRVD